MMTAMHLALDKEGILVLVKTCFFESIKQVKLIHSFAFTRPIKSCLFVYLIKPVQSIFFHTRRSISLIIVGILFFFGIIISRSK